MAEIDDMLERRAEMSSANLRRTTMIGFALDLVVAGLLVVFKDALKLGDVIYVVAAVLVSWGLVMMLLFPRLPRWGLQRYRQMSGSPELGREEKK